MHTKQVGWMPRQQLEGKIRLGHVLVAEEGPSTGSGRPATPVGYCIGNDQYFKRDDVGIIYQLNVAPGAQRKLIGASLLKAMLDRAAYGCRLFCCWCAQDIEANYFWESLGFVPLAFRAGSRDKGRIHIFWQRRIREGDCETPWWFPSQTSSGSIREDRLVFPIPPGMHWKDEMPRILPSDTTPKLEEPRAGKLRGQLRGPKSKAEKPAVSSLGRLEFMQPAPVVEKPRRQKRPRLKNDPVLAAKARELKDRWLEQVNAPGGSELLLPAGKYDVCRVITAGDLSAAAPRALPAAA
jgi:GNAT superfamily N-acetyltransferase